MSRGTERRPTVSPRWLVMDCIGGVLLVVGVLGLTGTFAGVAPALGDPQIAWTLLVVGAALMAFAAVKETQKNPGIPPRGPMNEALKNGVFQTILRLVAELRARGAARG